MFSADLSWNDAQTESVGARRERKARNRKGSLSDTSTSQRISPASKKSSTKSTKTVSTAATTPPPILTAKAPTKSNGLGAFRKSSFRKNKAPEQKATPGPSAVKSNLTNNVRFETVAEQPDVKLTVNDVKRSPANKRVIDNDLIERIERPSLSHETSGRTQYSRFSNGNKTDGTRTWAIKTKAEAENVLKSYDQMREKIYGMQTDRETFLDNDSSVVDARVDSRYSQAQFDPDDILELPADNYEDHAPYMPGPHVPMRSPLRTSSHGTVGQSSIDTIGYDSQGPTPHAVSDDSSDEADPMNSVDIMEQLPAILQTVTVECVEERTRNRTPRPSRPQDAPQPPPPPPPPPGPPRSKPPRSQSHQSEAPPGSTPQNSSRPRSINKSQWQAPSNWKSETVHNSLKETRGATSGSETSTDFMQNNKRHSNMSAERKRKKSPDEVNHFQRFVRRMETAGPRIILDRLKEEWVESTDEHREEVMMEKHLWALTALHLKALEKFTSAGSLDAPLLPISNNGRRRKILELDGNLAEIYQISAMYPEAKIAYLQPTPGEPIKLDLPAQTEVHPLPEQLRHRDLNPATFPFLPLHYPSNSIHHIRAARLPSLLPVHQLQALLLECYRVLKPGGILELRLIDPLPERGTTGPLLLSWLEDRLLIGLEAGFRCTRPLALVPRWTQEAGFSPLSDAAGNTTQTPTISLNSMYSTRSRGGAGKLALTRCLKLPAATEDEQPHQYHPEYQVQADTGLRPILHPSSASQLSIASTSGLPTPGPQRLPLRHFNSSATVPTTLIEHTQSKTTSAQQVRDKVVDQLGCLVARALWKDTWGEFLCDPEETGVGGMLNGGNQVVEDYWWWEDEEILRECRAWETVWGVGTLVVEKRGKTDGA